MLKIRLRRQGTRNAPFYRVVVSDQRRVPGSAAIEELGYFDPKRSPKVISLKEEHIDYWVSKGAQMSPTVRRMRGKSNVGEDGQVVATETESKTASTATPVRRFCSRSGMPSFSKVSSSSGSTSSRLSSCFFGFGAE